MQATNDHRVLVGVGTAATVEKAVIRWPSGRTITLENLKVDQDYKVVEPARPTTRGQAGRRCAREGQAPAAIRAAKGQGGSREVTSARSELCGDSLRAEAIAHARPPPIIVPGLRTG